jgi:catechol 2,3-dioxygenase-like lactoylglutathione lyase family enzyme
MSAPARASRSAHTLTNAISSVSASDYAWPVLRGVDNFGIAATDLDRTIPSYEMLGWQVLERSEPGATLGAEGAKLFLFRAAAGDSLARGNDFFANPAGIDHISLLVDDVDEAYAQLRDQGIEFTQAPDTDWGARLAALSEVRKSARCTPIRLRKLEKSACAVRIST